MKKLSLFFILLVSLSGHCQSDFSKSRVIQSETLSHDEIYSSIIEWFAVNYNSSKDVIEVDDKEIGLIVGKAIMQYEPSKGVAGCYAGPISYTIKIQIKDGRYKAELSDFYHESGMINSAVNCSLGEITNDEVHSTKGMLKKGNNEAWIDIKNMITIYSGKLFTSLEEHSNNAIAENDW